MAGEYIVKWTDDQSGTNPLKPRFVIQPKTINGPGYTDTDTPLELPGRFVAEYGEALMNSFVWIMENFSAPTEPTPATSGMLWFDSANEILKVRNTSNDAWLDVGAGEEVETSPAAYTQKIIPVTAANSHPSNPSIYFANSQSSPLTELTDGTTFYFTVDQAIEDLQTTSMLIQVDGFGTTQAGPDASYLMTPMTHRTPSDTHYKTNRIYCATFRQNEGVFYAYDPLYLVFTLESVLQQPSTSLPVNVSDANITLDGTHDSKYVRFTNAGAVTVTVPDNATAGFDLGAEIHLRAVTDGTVTIVGAAGVIINAPASGGLVLAEAGAAATLKKVDTDEWDIMGQVSA